MGTMSKNELALQYAQQDGKEFPNSFHYFQAIVEWNRLQAQELIATLPK